MKAENTKDTANPKKGKGCLTTIIVIIVALGLLVACFGEVEDPADATTEVIEESKQENTTQEQGTTEQKETKNEKQRKEAKKIDEQFSDIAGKTDASYEKLLNGIQKFADDGENADVLELYNLAKYVKDDCFMYFQEANDISYNGAENYKESLLSYIVTCQSVAENFMKYIDKSEMKYLSKTQKLMEDKNTFAIQLASDQLQFLEANGFTTDEIDKMLNE